MTIAIPETPTVGLGKFIKENRFLVPNHQRDYSWKQEYVEQFLSDVEESLAKNEMIYFCGLMVFTKNSSPSLKVLDGQQRLATTLMIFSAIRNWLSAYGAYKQSQFAFQLGQFLADSDIGSIRRHEREHHTRY